ncbi:hypothetical protein CEXT_224171 [Caerostris extrusa]|uniref:Uncharacterized protein n=1 Tax=Caerostris extrusa TaxID=172846 RepID=A0AAV4SYC4_CAEEX|nr:hypothetical protein CEXT_224171 [Caerostris extrusa]
MPEEKLRSEVWSQAILTIGLADVFFPQEVPLPTLYQAGKKAFKMLRRFVRVSHAKRSMEDCVHVSDRERQDGPVWAKMFGDEVQCTDEDSSMLEVNSPIGTHCEMGV